MAIKYNESTKSFDVLGEVSLLNSSQTVDQKKLLIAHHEAGHAVMALIFRQRIEIVSLKCVVAPNWTGHFSYVETGSPCSSRSMPSARPEDS